MNNYRKEEERRVSKGLTKQDVEIIKMICQEKTSDQIAKELGRSVRTIEGSRLAIMKIIGVKSLVGIVTYAIRVGHFTVHIES